MGVAVARSGGCITATPTVETAGVPETEKVSTFDTREGDIRSAFRARLACPAPGDHVQVGINPVHPFAPPESGVTSAEVSCAILCVGRAL